MENRVIKFRWCPKCQKWLSQEDYQWRVIPSFPCPGCGSVTQNKP